MTQDLGRLEEVPLRDGWQVEDRNFTPCWTRSDWEKRIERCQKRLAK